MRMHRDASYEHRRRPAIKGELLEAAQRAWDEAVELGEEHGYRNAQATVLAPTGTISFLMDCDTTGIEPDFSLVKFKELVGGGQMTIVNRSVPLALRTLGYADAEIEQIDAHITEKGTIVGAPGPQGRAPAGLRRRGRRAGDLPHRPHRHDGRDAAVHLRRDLEDGQPAADGDGRGHRRRLHARLEGRPEGAGDLPRRLEDGAGAAHRRAGGEGAEADADAAPPVRKRMPRERESITHKFSIAGHEGYITAGKYEDGSVGEIFLTDIGKEGSTLRGMMNAFATAISIGLQYGVPLEIFVSKFSYMRFDPEGITGNPEIPFAKSMPDYIMRWLASRFIEDTDDLEDLGILTPEVRAKQGGRSTAQLADDTAGPATTAATANGRQRPRETAARRAGGEPVPAAAALHRHPAGGPGQDVRPRPRPRLRAVRRHDAAHGLLLHLLAAAATTPAAAESGRPFGRRQAQSAWLIRTSGSQRSIRRGTCHARSPSRRRIAGSNSSRIKVASRRTARPRIAPISFGGRTPASEKVKKTKTITAAAALITRPEVAIPSIVACLASPVRSKCSFTEEAGRPCNPSPGRRSG